MATGSVSEKATIGHGGHRAASRGPTTVHTEAASAAQHSAATAAWTVT